jgi:hypothetical protein
VLTVSFASAARPPGPRPGREVNHWRDESGQLFARGYSDGRRHRIEWPGLATFDFAIGSLVVRTWLDEPGSERAAEDAVLRVLQPMILQALGWQALHASGVVAGSRVAAFCGRSGSGKSTIAYALAARGCSQLADDGLVLRIDPPSIEVQPLAFAPRLRPASHAHFGDPELRRSVARRAAPLGVVFLLEPDPDLDEPVVDDVRPVEAFRALVTHAHCFDPATRTSTGPLVRAYMEIADRVPVRRVRYRPDLDRLGAVVDRILKAGGEVGVRRQSLEVVR